MGRISKHFNKVVDPLDDVEAEVVALEERRKEIATISNERSISDRITDMLTYHTPESHMRTLPRSVAGIHGCLSCPWADTLECPELDSHGRTKIPKRKICGKKDYWLKLFSRKDKYNSYAEWSRDYKLGMADKVMLSNYNRMAILSLEKTQAYENCDMELFRKLSAELKECEGKWLHLIELTLKYDDKQVDRETPKQVNIDNRATLDLASVNNIIRGKHLPSEEVIEAEISDVDKPDEETVNQDKDDITSIKTDYLEKQETAKETKKGRVNK